jgi:hypothetical protein
MILNIEEIYSIKVTIVHTLFLGRPDWRERITVDVNSQNGSAYLEFRTASTRITLDDRDPIRVTCTDGRKPIKFKHESLDMTNERIAAQLRAHIGDPI